MVQQPHHQPAPSRRLPVVLACLAAVGLLIALPLLARWLGVLGGLEMASLKEWIKSFGMASVIASWFVMTMTALTVLPAEVPAMVNGMIYGSMIGCVVTWSGAMIGANVAYFIGRSVGPSLIDRWVGKDKADRFRRGVEANGTALLLLARCIPIIPFFAINYLSGASSIRWWTYNWVTAIGILPMTIALATMGDQAMKMSWELWLTILLVLIAALLLLRSVVRRTGFGARLLSGFGPPNTADEVNTLKQ
ncbi:MAG: TVP38/TMEM64 family protein [Pseudomonadota bacterium]